jgi:hypothetical protein
MIRRRVRKSTKGGTFPVQLILLTTVVLWFGVALFGVLRLMLLTATSRPDDITTAELKEEPYDENVIELHLVQTIPPVTIRLKLFAEEAPDAARFVKEVAAGASNGSSGSSDCNLYRAEPVPEYWGSPDRPDRWFDGGRWGPPYALIQGKFTSPVNNAENAKAEEHRPIIERGMVAWAGGKGGPHFFIALADHPEWGHGHTVWATVLKEDMALVDALMKHPLRMVTPKQPPILSYFVSPIDFTVTSN